MSKCPYHDPFKEARKAGPVLATEYDDAPVPMILGLKDVRKAARDWKSFSSNAPFRIPIPNEKHVRTLRQFPLEADPPEHTDYRSIIEPFFKRATEPEYVKKIDDIVEEMLLVATQGESIEIVRSFCVPLQSKALTVLMNMPYSEANVWISWGTNIFRDPVTGDGKEKGDALEKYCNECFDKAEANPGENFFSLLTKAKYQGRDLTRKEMLGYANLAFAGGRDTIINTVSMIISYIADNPDALDKLRESPKMIVTATEEFIRYTTPLTQMGRLCPVDTEVHGEQVKAGNLISLCWASANFDETVFDTPEEVRLDRMPNPHVAFGNGPHNCLGAAHARLLIRTLLTKLAEKVSSIELIDKEENIESELDYDRVNAYESLTVKFNTK